MMALKDTAATGVVRVLWNDFVRVKQALDVGAEGIVFPWSTPSSRPGPPSPPPAIRRAGTAAGGRAAPARSQRTRWNYFLHAEENILVLCQIETRRRGWTTRKPSRGGRRWTL